MVRVSARQHVDLCDQISANILQYHIMKNLDMCSRGKRKIMKQLSVKTIVAIGIGSALFFVLAKFVSIPTFVSNTTINLQYAVLAVLALLFGPIAGALIGFIGHLLNDASSSWGIWYSWIAGSAFFGLAMGFLGMKIRLDDGVFGIKEIVLFNVTQVVAHLISWGLIAPGLDVLIYDEPIEKIFLQGAVGSVSNIVSTAIVGTILCVAYVAARPKKGSLAKEN